MTNSLQWLAKNIISQTKCLCQICTHILVLHDIWLEIHCQVSSKVLHELGSVTYDVLELAWLAIYLPVISIAVLIPYSSTYWLELLIIYLELSFSMKKVVWSRETVAQQALRVFLLNIMSPLSLGFLCIIQIHVSDSMYRHAGFRMQKWTDIFSKLWKSTQSPNSLSHTDNYCATIKCREVLNFLQVGYCQTGCPSEIIVWLNWELCGYIWGLTWDLMMMKDHSLLWDQWTHYLW